MKCLDDTFDKSSLSLPYPEGYESLQGKILINSPKTEISFCWHVLVNVDGSGALSHHQIRIEHCFEA